MSEIYPILLDSITYVNLTIVSDVIVILVNKTIISTSIIFLFNMILLNTTLNVNLNIIWKIRRVLIDSTVVLTL